MGVTTERLAARRQKAIGDASNNFGGALATMLGGNFAVNARSTEELLAATASNSWAHLASTLKAIREAETQWHLLRPGPKSSRREHGIHARRLEAPVGNSAAVGDRAKYIADLKITGFLVDQQEHPFLEMRRQGTMWSKNPNIQLGGFEVSRLFSITREAVGEWYVALIRDPKIGIPIRWLPLPPHWVTPPSGAQRNYEVYRKGLTIPPEDMAVYRQPNPPDPYDRGKGDLNAADHETRVDELGVQHLAGTLQNHGVPYLLMVLSGLEKGERRKMELEWKSELTGPWKAGLTKFLETPEGMSANEAFQIKELQQSPVQLQVSELRKHERDAILQASRVAPLAAGVHDSGNRAMALVAEKLMMQNAIVPAREAARAWFTDRFFRRVGGREPEYRGDWIVNWSAPEITDEGSRDRMMAQVPAHFSRAQFLQVAGAQPRPGDEDLYVIGSNQVIYNRQTNQIVFAPPQPQGNPFGADIETPVTKFEDQLVALASIVDRMEFGGAGQGV